MQALPRSVCLIILPQVLMKQTDREPHGEECHNGFSNGSPPRKGGANDHEPT